MRRLVKCRRLYVQFLLRANSGPGRLRSSSTSFVYYARLRLVNFAVGCEAVGFNAVSLSAV